MSSIARVNLPLFTNCDVAEFDAWVNAYVAARQETYNDKWWVDAELIDREIAGVLERAEKVRARLLSGEARLRFRPPHGYPLPPYAARLAEYVLPSHIRGAPDTEAGAGSWSSSSWPPLPLATTGAPQPAEPTDFVVDGHAPSPSIEQLQQALEPRRTPGRRRLGAETKRSDYALILKLEEQGFTGDKALAREARKHGRKWSPSTVRRRRLDGEKLSAPG